MPPLPLFTVAKLNFGPIVADARNKQGNVVFSRNRYGAYSRPFILTPNPDSTPQQVARLAWKTAGQFWYAVLTPLQRAAWRTFANRYQLSDVFGNPYFADGHGTYQRITMRLLMAGLPTYNDPPTDQQVGGPGPLTAAPDSPAPGSLTITASTPPAPNELPQVWAAPQRPTSWTYFFRNLRLLTTFAPGDPGPWDVGAAYIAAANAWNALNPTEYPVPTLGQMVGLGVRYLNAENGATSPIVTVPSTMPTVEVDMLLKRTVVLTDADIKALPTTPFELIPAPGVDKALVIPGFPAVCSAFLTLDWHADYTNIDPTAYFRLSIDQFTYATFAHETELLAWGLSASAYLASPSGAGDTVQNPPYSLNQSLLLSMSNGALGPLTGGDPLNTLTVTIFYAIAP